LQFFAIVGTMGLIGLLLAMTGLYALTSYSVSRRLKEFGIRMAIGAGARDVVWLVERRGIVLAASGILIGGALAAAVTPMLAAAFPGLGASPVAVYVVVPLALLAVSAAATYVPARRAAGVDPLITLRSE
jgi:ABC-type antimicrobial peptide transport system permease subunit